MAFLKGSAEGESWVLTSEQDLGRAPRCGLHLEHPLVSGVHATLRWRPNGGWQIKDLNSKNGTYVGGALLQPEQWHPLTEGALLAFGEPKHTFTLSDAGAPRPVVVLLGSEQRFVLEGETLGLPSEDEPLATVLRGRNGNWVAELHDQVIDLTEQPLFEVAGRTYQFIGAQLSTATTAGRETNGPGQPTLRLRFSVSRDEEHVELSVEGGEQTFKLPPRAYHYMLLTLARHKLDDLARGLPETSCGWVYQDELATELGISPNKLNVDIFRLRQQLGGLPVAVAQVIERRPRTGQLRTGVVHLVVDRL